MRYSIQLYALLWLVGISAMLFGPTLPSACAQPESLADWSTKAKADPTPVDKKVAFPGLSTALRTGQFENAGDDQRFADLYDKRVFPNITNPKTRGESQDVVVKLRSDFKMLGKFSDSPVRDKLEDITLEYMTPIAKDGKWQPAVRENALLAIGEIKSPKAVPVLLEFIKSRDQHPMFKVAAMAGIVRLAEQGVLAGPSVADPVVPVMVIIADGKKVPSNDGWRWMRGQAADILGAIGSTGKKGEVPAALLAMVADEELPLIIRGKAARALGKLKYDNLPDAKNYVQTFAQFGSDALADNLPGEYRRIWAVCDDFLGGLKPLMTSGAAPKLAQSINDSVDELKRLASKPKSGGGYASEEELKPAVAKARKVLEAAAGRK
jgi:HEAT repeat protein